jgi:hypothetical protein
VNGTVTIGTYEVTLPEEDARTLFLAAMVVQKRSQPLAVTADTMLVITPATPITIVIAGGFAGERTPDQVVAAAHKRATAPRTMRLL